MPPSLQLHLLEQSITQFQTLNVSFQIEMKKWQKFTPWRIQKKKKTKTFSIPFFTFLLGRKQSNFEIV